MRVTRRRRREPARQHRVGAERSLEQPRRIGQRPPVGRHDAGVGELSRQRRDSNVESGPHVHFPEGAQVRHALEVRADRPAAGAGREARHAKGTREPRVRAVCGNRHRRRELDRPAVPAGDDEPGNNAVRDPRLAHQDPLLHLCACLSRRVEQRRIEHAAWQAPAGHRAAVSPDDPHTGVAGDDHAVHAPAALAHEAEAQPRQHRQRARIQRVAAQLVARKPGAIEHPHAHPRPREHDAPQPPPPARRRRSERAFVAMPRPPATTRGYWRQPAIILGPRGPTPAGTRGFGFASPLVISDSLLSGAF